MRTEDAGRCCHGPSSNLAMPQLASVHSDRSNLNSLTMAQFIRQSQLDTVFAFLLSY